MDSGCEIGMRLPRTVDSFAIVYYRKDASWLAHSPIDPPVEHSPDSLVEVHRLKVSYESQPDTSERLSKMMCENIWKKMQNIDSPGGDLPAELGVRSMMHGDMIVMGGRAFECLMTGWREVRPEWLVKGDFPKSFPELALDREESSQEDAASQS